jgi:hypothetical protein
MAGEIIEGKRTRSSRGLVDVPSSCLPDQHEVEVLDHGGSIGKVVALRTPSRAGITTSSTLVPMKQAISNSETPAAIPNVA